MVVLSEHLSNRLSSIGHHLLDILPALNEPYERPSVLPRRRQTHLDMDDYVRVAMAYEAGASMPEVAARFGLHKATVSEILQRLGVEARARRFFTPEQVEAVCQQYLAGASLGQLGKLYGCYPTTIMRTLERAGVARRAAN